MRNGFRLAQSRGLGSRKGVLPRPGEVGFGNFRGEMALDKPEAADWSPPVTWRFQKWCLYCRNPSVHENGRSRHHLDLPFRPVTPGRGLQGLLQTPHASCTVFITRCFGYRCSRKQRLLQILFSVRFHVLTWYPLSCLITF